SRLRAWDSARSACATLFSFSCAGPPRALHSFPTRRSSDLLRAASLAAGKRAAVRRRRRSTASVRPRCRAGFDDVPGTLTGPRNRSEEHTSELQSRENLVCRLLLEKKKQKM